MFFGRLADRGEIVYFSGRPPSLGSTVPQALYVGLLVEPKSQKWDGASFKGHQ